MEVHADNSAIQDHPSIAAIAEAACRLAGHQDIRAVHVVSSQRPTYDELLRVRQCASAQGVELTVAASGVSFHRPAGPLETWDDVPLLMRWLRVHTQKWRPDLNTLTEGTR